MIKVPWTSTGLGWLLILVVFLFALLTLVGVHTVLSEPVLLILLLAIGILI
jgi:hypothetical protein